MKPERNTPGRPAVFLHGLESSSRGFKGRWLAEHFPAVRMRDHHGDLSERLDQLTDQVAGLDDLILIGSSFGGLMALAFAARHPARCRRLVLLAPALNFPEHRHPAETLDVAAFLVIGAQDTVCPPDVVLPIARACLRDVQIRVVDDDHLLRRTVPVLDWARLLG